MKRRTGSDPNKLGHDKKQIDSMWKGTRLGLSRSRLYTFLERPVMKAVVKEW